MNGHCLALVTKSKACLAALPKVGRTLMNFVPGR